MDIIVKNLIYIGISHVKSFHSSSEEHKNKKNEVWCEYCGKYI